PRRPPTARRRGRARCAATRARPPAPAQTLRPRPLGPPRARSPRRPPDPAANGSRSFRCSCPARYPAARAGTVPGVDITITGVDVRDVRFPTSRTLAGSDAMNAAPDYSAAYVILITDSELQGHGMT